MHWSAAALLTLGCTCPRYDVISHELTKSEEALAWTFVRPSPGSSTHDHQLLGLQLEKRILTQVSHTNSTSKIKHSPTVIVKNIRSFTLFHDTFRDSRYALSDVLLAKLVQRLRARVHGHAAPPGGASSDSRLLAVVMVIQVFTLKRIRFITPKMSLPEL